MQHTSRPALDHAFRPNLNWAPVFTFYAHLSQAMAIPTMAFSRIQLKVEQSADLTEKDELDIMACSSPAPASPAKSGRVLRARASMGNNTPLKQNKRERGLSTSNVENHQGVVGKKRKMEDKKAVCPILSPILWAE